MPLSTQATGCVDFALPLEKIAEHFVATGMNSTKLPNGYFIEMSAVKEDQGLIKL